jgi:hypothetical protein
LESTLTALRSLRTILGIEDPPSKEIIDKGFLRDLINILETSQNEMIIFETLWLFLVLYFSSHILNLLNISRCISNLSAGDHNCTEAILNYAPCLIRFIKTGDFGAQLNSQRVREQTCWVLGNIFGDCNDCRTKLHSFDVLPSILSLLFPAPHELINENSKKIAAWTISNSIRGSNISAAVLLKYGYFT